MSFPDSGSRAARPAGLAFLALLLVVGCGEARRPVEDTPRPAATAPDDPAAPDPDPATGVTHVVEPGQTLWRIAHTYGVELDRLARANGIDDPTRIEVGQRLTIPGATEVLAVPSTSARNGSVHEWTWPVAGGEVLSGFGAPRGGQRIHKGLDIRGRHGQPVVAVAAGRVVYSGSTMRGYGKTVVVDHGGGLRSLYAHNSRLLVQPGDRVLEGEPIARVGQTGNATTAHCHLEIRQNQVPVDPLLYVARQEIR